jgi:hypothetical protein
MVDDMDDIIRAAVVNGDVETVFPRHLENFVSNSYNLASIRTIYTKTLKQDKIMRTKQGNKNNHDVYREFSETRFLWTFCEQYCVARNAGQLDFFWGVVRKSMDKYDDENPTGRRQQRNSPPSAINQRTRPPLPTRKSLETPKVTSPPLPKPTNTEQRLPLPKNLASGLLPPQPKSAKQPKESGPVFSMQTPANATPHPKGTPVGAAVHSKRFSPADGADKSVWNAPATQQTPPAMILPSSGVIDHSFNFSPPSVKVPLPHSKSRPRSPSPIPGPSKPRVPVSAPPRNPSVSSISSAPTSYIAGYRIPWKPGGKTKLTAEPEFVVPDDVTRPDDSDEYEPSIKVKHDVKGKGKAKEQAKKSERRVRKEPENTRELRENPCARCVRLKMDCFAQAIGSACFGCAMVKVKCDEVVEKRLKKVKVRKEKKIPTKPAAIRSKPARKPARAQDEDEDEQSSATASSAPATDTKRRASSPLPVPSAKRRRTSKKEDTASAEMEDLRKELGRQREILDAVLPGYLRLKDQVAELEEKVEKNYIKLADVLIELEDDIKGHSGKIKSLDKDMRGHSGQIISLEKETTRTVEKFKWMYRTLKDMKKSYEKMKEGTESDNDSIQIVNRPDDVKIKGSIQIVDRPDDVQTKAIEDVWEYDEELVINDQDDDIDEVTMPSVEEERISANSARAVTQLDFSAPATGLEVREHSIGVTDLPADMPPPPQPTSPPPPTHSPPPLTPAVTLQPPTPYTSQEGAAAEPSTLLNVPANDTQDPNIQDPDGISPDAPIGHWRSASHAGSEPRRSPRLQSRSPSPLPPSIPAKRKADDSGVDVAAKKGRKK